LNTIQTQQHNISLGQKVLQEQADNYESGLFYLPKHTYYSASTSVGSGKTLAAIDYMLSAEKSLKNFLYVAPTIKLVEQTTKGLKEALQQTKRKTRNVNLVHSINTSEKQSASQVAINTFNDSTANTGVIVILTTTTFLNILPLIRNKKEWSVVMDEAFSPVSFVKYELGQRVDIKSHNRQYFSNLFQIDDNDNKSITPTTGKTNLVREIARNNWKEVGSMYRGMQPLAQAVTNSALRVELTEMRKDRFTFATWVTPEHFNDFRECIFLAALFEETILYHLWSREYQATFKPHRFFDEVIDRNIHTSQGHFVSVGHLLHPEDHASKYNLQRNYQTGKRDAQEGLRVIDKCVDISQTYFTNTSMLLQVNAWTGHTNRHQPNKNVTVIPCMSQGINEYQDHKAIAALAVTNPEPHMLKWLKERTQLPEKTLYRAFRIHNVYQACGRTAIRNWGNTDQVTFLVVGKEDALFLHELFENSTWLGQVGDIESLKKLNKNNTPKATLESDPDYQQLRLQYKRLNTRINSAKKSMKTPEAIDILTFENIKESIATLKVDYESNQEKEHLNRYFRNDIS